MKGILYLTLLLALLIVVYLTLKQLTTPTTAAAPLGKDSATLQEIPALAKEKVNQAMELEAQQQKALEKQMQDAGE